MAEAIIVWIHNVGLALVGWALLGTLQCWDLSDDGDSEWWICEWTDARSPEIDAYHNSGYGKSLVQPDAVFYIHKE